MPVAGNPWKRERGWVVNASCGSLGWNSARGHTRAVGGDDGWRAGILGLSLEGTVAQCR